MAWSGSGSGTVDGFASSASQTAPTPAPFEAALSALSVRPERAVHVGNSLRSDVAGARAAGVRRSEERRVGKECRL